MASGPITSWEIDGETVETVSDFYFGGRQNHCRWRQQAVSLSNLHTTASSAVRLFKYLKYQHNDAYILLLKNATKF